MASVRARCGTLLLLLAAPPSPCTWDSRNLLLTLCSASAGHSVNQSMVVQLMRDGNWRHLQGQEKVRYLLTALGLKGTNQVRGGQLRVELGQHCTLAQNKGQYDNGNFKRIRA